MTATMSYRGPDGVGTLSSGPAALGHCMLRTTQEALEEVQPLANEDATVMLVMDGYLTNWEELRQSLTERGARLRTRSDAELVLRAYEEWGEDCPKHIDGEYSLLIWDERRQASFCARDHQGLRTLYYHWHNGRLVVASDIAAIIGVLAEHPRLNVGFLAEMMAEEWYSLTETLWVGIERLEPAHGMRVTRNGPQFSAYWTLPLEAPIRYPREEEYIEHYRHLLFDCVRRTSRSHRPLAFEVSGGLDSSSLFCVAERLLIDTKLLAPNIKGYTLKGPEGSAADEIKFARAAGAHVGREVEELPLFKPGLEWFAQYARQCWDVPGYPNGTMSVGLERRARQADCRAIVNGVGGDQWLNGSTLYYGEALESRKFFEFLQLAKDDTSIYGYKKTGEIVARSLLNSFLGETVKKHVRSIIHKRDVSAFWLSANTQNALLDRRRKYLERLRESGTGAAKVDKLLSPFGLFGLDIMSRQRALNGVEGRSPMLTRAFIEFSVASPERLRLQRGVTKAIHRKAMRGILPDLICDRQSKAEFSPAWEGLIATLAASLDGVLDAGPPLGLDPAGITKLREICDCDVSNMRYCWETLAIWLGHLFLKELEGFQNELEEKLE